MSVTDNNQLLGMLLSKYTTHGKCLNPYPLQSGTQLMDLSVMILGGPDQHSANVDCSIIRCCIAA